MWADGYTAEGNPDEEKIGAFGVGTLSAFILCDFTLISCLSGFYSLFSVTEEPFVTSGGEPQGPFIVITTYILSGQWMGFYWKDKKDQASKLPYFSLYIDRLVVA